MPIIPVLKRLRQEECEFETSLGCTVRPCVKDKTKDTLHSEERGVEELP
jgi:hypothetical protein